jgi:branched-chain amino acid aminotransferase
VLFKQSPSRLILAAWEGSRSYSIQAKAASTAKLQDIDLSKLSITKTTTPKELVPPNELVFGRTFTGSHPLSNSALQF